MGEENINLQLFRYEGVTKFKSIRRAIKRGHVSNFGAVYPKRPFNNRSRLKGTRPLEEKKEAIYERFKKGYKS